MKTKILLLSLLFIGLFFVTSCEDNDNISPKTYDFTESESNVFSYNNNDTLYFTSYWRETEESIDEDPTVIYYVLFGKDSGYVESNGNKFAFLKIKMGIPNEGNYWIFTQQKIELGYKMIIEKYDDGLSPNPILYKLENPKQIYDTLTLNHILYNNVNMYQYDANGNITDPLLFQRFYFSESKGLIAFQEPFYINYRNYEN